MNIPKKIHYIWLGGKKKPRSFKSVFSSWERYASEFQIVEWNESNIGEFSLPPRFYTLCKQKKWAFASDVLRFHILDKYGGIYFDIDQVLIKNIPETFLKHPFFISTYHQVDDYYGFGCIGSIPDSEVTREIKKAVDSYTGGDIIINKIGGEIINRIRNQKQNSAHIFPQEYFYPLTKKDFTENTYSYHLANTSWVPWYKKLLHKIPGYIHIQRTIKKLIPKSIFKKVFKIDYL